MGKNVRGRRIMAKTHMPLREGSVISLKVEEVHPNPVLKMLGTINENVKTINTSMILTGLKKNLWKTIIENIEQKHLDIVRTLLPIQQQSATLSIVKQLINEIEANCEGLFMLKELSPRMKDKIVCYGELLSSKIISATFAAKGIKQQWVDARELIKTDSNFLNAVVDKALTNKTIQDYFKNPANAFDLYIAPGFISSDKEGNTTTLGRGGSDYTGAIFAAALDAERLNLDGCKWYDDR